MFKIKKELEIRRREVRNLLKFVNFIENEKTLPIEDGIELLTVKTCVKANVVLMIYNAVESTVTNCLSYLHETINSEGIVYSELSKHVKKLLAIYYGYSIINEKLIDDKMERILTFMDFVMNKSKIALSYETISQEYHLYSGNLDAKKIKKIYAKYGIDLDCSCPELKKIKDDRNKLAHGEDSFEEIGRDISIEELNVMVDRSFSYLDDIVSVVGEYCEGKRYKCSS